MQVTYIPENQPLDPKKMEPKSFDVIAYVYGCLMEAATLQSDHALLDAKALKENALSQQRLNEAEVGLTFTQVPADQITHVKDYTKYYTYYTDPDGFRFRNTHYVTKDIRSVVKNISVVEQAQLKNEQISLQRQVLTDRLMGLEQEAQRGVASVNTESDQSSQTMQEQTQVLDILKTLTFKAMLRQPVDG